MQIEIRFLTQLKQYLPAPELAGNTRSMEIEGDETIGDLFSRLGIPLDMPKVILLNDRQGTVEDRLKDGDRVTVVPPVGGG